jgi:geranylgeranylglycerol-phosphate geranylgeranyltransferase
MGTSFLMVSGANLINDIGDIDLDRKIHRERRTVRSDTPLSFYLKFSIILWTFGLLNTALVCIIVARWEPLAILIISMLLVLSYERWSKNRGLPGNITISILTGLTFIFGSSLTDSIPHTVLSFFFMASALNVSRELVKDIQDMKGDLGTRVTFPIRYGIKDSVFLARLSAILGMIVSIYLMFLGPFNPMYMVIITIGDFMIVKSFLTSQTNPESSQRLLKIGMIFALIAFYSFSFY